MQWIRDPTVTRKVPGSNPVTEEVSKCQTEQKTKFSLFSRAHKSINFQISTKKILLKGLSTLGHFLNEVLRPQFLSDILETWDVQPHGSYFFPCKNIAK